MQRRFGWTLVWSVLLAAALSWTARATPLVYFDMEDPTGDDYGPGTYQYPKNDAFAPFSGLFDLTRFRVWSDPNEGDDIIFDLSFGAMSNPWAAPEGFIHQLINIYIDTRPGGGRVQTLKPGAMIRFPEDQGWEVFIRGAGWDGSACYYLDPQGNMVSAPVRAGLQADGHTIRLRVPRSCIGIPESGWGYYVLVGAYDGFGTDNFRAVAGKTGDWNFGGGRGSGVDPNIIDMLAPRGGGMRQERQLSSSDPKEGTHATVYPVRAGGGGFIPTAGLIAGGLVFLAGLGYLAVRNGWQKHLPRLFHWKVARAGGRA